jgi:hypothetical protein
VDTLTDHATLELCERAGDLKGRGISHRICEGVFLPLSYSPWPRQPNVSGDTFGGRKQSRWHDTEPTALLFGPRPAGTTRRFPPPRSVEEQSACFLVRDGNGQQLA